MVKSVREIIEEAGGEEAIAKASARTAWPIGSDAVRKWPQKLGIPQWHWPVVMSLSDATEVDILAANQALKTKRRKPGPKPRSRRPKRRALAEALL